MHLQPQHPAAILVIDDDPLTLTALAAMLHLAGNECHCARDCEGAVKAARSLKPDLIVCDIDLEGENGLDLCRELKQEHGLEDTPIVFLSTAESPDIVRRAREAGGLYYVRKPFDPEVLVELINKALWMPHLVSARIRHLVREPAAEVPSGGLT
jgi:DNA-binding response OmpR family regulator